MGADLIINTLATKHPSQLNWHAGFQVINTLVRDAAGLILETTALSDWLEDGMDACTEDLQEELDGALRDLRGSWTQGWRDQDRLEFGEWTIWVAGVTGGDSLTLDAMAILSEVPEVLKAVGFDWPTRRMSENA